MKLRQALIFLLLCSFNVSAQDSFAAILKEHHSEPFVEICTKIEDYFISKHPNLSPQEMSTGAHRDGEYVKYKRWQHFWKSRIDTLGYQADLAHYHKQTKNDKVLSRSDGPLDDLEWNNISYNKDLGVQIGLGRTNSVAFHPTDPMTFYVGTAIGGLWKTQDGGQNYSPIGDDLPFLAVSCVVVNQENPDIIYIAISDRVFYGPPSIGIYKSIDGGNSWSPTSLRFEFKEDTRIYWLEADPNNPDIMLAGTSNGLYRTEDGFVSHQKITGDSVCDVKFMPGNSDVVYYVTDNSTGFYKSSDGGKRFSSTYLVGEDYKRILVTPLNPNKVFVSSSFLFSATETESSERLYESYDAGETLTRSRDISDIRSLDGICIFSQLSETDIYAGWFNLHHSSDGGENFDQISDWLGRENLPLVHVDYRNAFCNPLQKELIYLCNDGGLYTVNVTNNEFTNLSNGLQITQYYDIGVSQADESLVSGGSQDNGNVLLFGQDWFPTAPTSDGMMQALDPYNPDMVYNAIQFGLIYRYNNGVEDVISNNLPAGVGNNGEWVTPFQCAPTLPDVLYAAYEKVYSTSDNGDSWEAISDELAGGHDLDLIEVAPSDDERIYVVENYGKSTGNLYGLGHNNSDLFENVSGLKNWNSINLPVLESVEDIAVDPENPDHLYLVCSGYRVGHKVFESYDAGQSWQNISGALPNMPATAITYFEDLHDYLFVGTDNGVYYSRADIIDWRTAGDFPNTYISEIEIQEEAKLIRVGTHGRGIFEGSVNLKDTAVGDIEQEDCISVYPNPTKSILQVSNLGAGTTLEILNTVGQVLFTGSKATIDLSQFEAGTYYLKSISKANQPPCLTKVIKL